MRLLFLSLLLVPPLALAENWPGWRGPRGDGSCLEIGIATSWSNSDNVVWKVPVFGKGHASPIVWEDRIFVVTNEDEARILLCFDTNGTLKWRRTVLEAPRERVHRYNSHASSTPVTDGKTVFTSFLDQDQMHIAAYDFAGKQLWAVRPGVFSSIHGYCSSPILWKDSVIINGDHDGEAYIVALDKASGKTVWKTPRPNKTRSYCTPIVRHIDGRDQMIMSGSISVASFDPNSGKQHWVIDGPTEQFVASLVYNGDLLFMTCGFPERHMLAIRPDGHGNVTDTHVAWRTKVAPSYVPSPVAIDKYFVVVSDEGVATAWEAATGREVWLERFRGKHWASLVTVEGLIHITSERGITRIVRPGERFEIVATNDLGESVYASPVISSGKLYLRGDKHLFCIADN
jgi:outer membrane protein assembly factor BamB